MPGRASIKRWRTWPALIFIPLICSCVASSWPISGPALNSVHETFTPIPLYIPEYLKDDRPRSEYLFHPPTRLVLSQFVTRVTKQSQPLGIRLVSEPSPKGIFCTLYFRALEPTTAEQLNSLLSILTYFLFPTYDSSITFELTYDVFSDTHFVRQYRYQVHGKRLTWLLMPFALPFMSGYWEPTIQPQAGIPDGLIQGLLSTLTQLKADGQRDGLFE